MTTSTAEDACALGARHGDQGRVNSLRDPASGTLEITPALRLKARKAIEREVRLLKLRLYLRLVRLQFAKLALQFRSTLLKARVLLDR